MKPEEMLNSLRDVKGSLEELSMKYFETAADQDGLFGDEDKDSLAANGFQGDLLDTASKLISVAAGCIRQSEDIGTKWGDDL